MHDVTQASLDFLASKDGQMVLEVLRRPNLPDVELRRILQFVHVDGATRRLNTEVTDLAVQLTMAGIAVPLDTEEQSGRTV